MTPPPGCRCETAGQPCSHPLVLPPDVRPSAQRSRAGWCPPRRCACRKPRPCWSDATHECCPCPLVWQVVLRQDDRPCCCDWPTLASPTLSPCSACSH